MSHVVRPSWLLILLSLAPMAQAQSLHRVLMAHGGHGGGGGGVGHSGGSLHGGFVGGAHDGFVGGVPGGFLASGISNHPGQRSGFGQYAVGGYGLGYGGYGLGYGGYGGYGFGYSYPLVVNNVMAVPLLWPVMGGQGFGGGFGTNGGGGLMLPMPPPQIAGNAVPVARHRNTTRSKELVEIGDRSFRGGNIKRAEDKYILAAKADPTSPMPHVHMAQVSLARGDYAAAADRLRDAVTVALEGGWLLTAPDIQTMFGEPTDFARHLARLESHLQANPNDRDAWFVLGAEYYLSGRSKQASDVFERLTDRKADEALAAFMDASKTKLPAPN
jgi:hypothetical protein